jgi:predicted NBD/HSP70 family sugar kinase
MLRLGIDIGGSSVKTVGIERGTVVWTEQSTSYSRADADTLIAAIAETIGRRLKNDQSVTVGMCVPGVLDVAKRAVTVAVNVPGLTKITLDELIRRALGKNAKLRWIGSDAVAAAYDAAQAKRLTGRVFSLAIGTGVGAAVLDNGKPLLVSENTPGHWGQVDVSIAGDNVIGPDGGAGGLEGYISAPALRRRYAVEDLSSAFAKMSAEDAPIQALVRAIRIGHAIYRPQYVLLLGGVGIQFKRLTGEIRRSVNRNLTRVAQKGWTLSVGDDVWHAARGAAALAK